MQVQYNDDMNNVTTSSSIFEEMIRDGSVYVDKTEYIYDLVSSREKFFFISRPRRYGKSLFCSTLHSLFDGKRELFKGLYIDKTDYDFRSYPVIHLNFALLSTQSSSWFQESLSSDIKHQGKILGVELEGSDPAQLLKDLIYVMKEVVIIIDEYDAPFTSSLDHDISLQMDMRNILSGFYSVIKNCSEYIRFFFMTGVVKLANLSIFSAMNNLRDLSMEGSFSAAFGYTDEELSEYFREGIDECLAENKGRYISRNELLGRIREYYDGYRFSPDSEVRVYNPVSIGCFFSSGCRFENYWDRTGTSTLAVELARRVNLVSIVDSGVEIRMSAFISFDLMDINRDRLRKENVAALLYFAGYLTIGGSDEDAVSLIFPNKEVASSFSENLLVRYMKDDIEEGSLIIKLGRTFRHGDEEGFMKAVNAYFDAFSYDLIGGERERFFHIAFHGIFVMLRLLAVSEDRGLHGRSDEAVLYGNDLWLFELKVNGSAEEALKQIDERRYAEKYGYIMKAGMTLHRIGVNFMTEERKLSWVIGRMENSHQ